jgi:hypothetical protein
MDVPPSLRAWFVVDFVVDTLVAVPILLAPESFLMRLGWTAIDPVSPRLLGAALLAMGAQSWRARNQGPDVLRALLGVKTIWTAAAIVGLVLAITQGAPSLTFALLATCLALSGVWIHYTIRLRQQAEAHTRPPAPDESESESDSAT